jgi:uncharacterized membrane protein YkvA (DUF1232 family)
MGWVARLKETARELKIETHAMYFAIRHPRTPWSARLVLIFILLYAASPIDIIPDFIPVLGMLDDIAVIAAGLWLARRLIPDAVMAECREKARTIDREGGLIRSLFRD